MRRLAKRLVQPRPHASGRLTPFLCPVTLARKPHSTVSTRELVKRIPHPPHGVQNHNHEMRRGYDPEVYSRVSANGVEDTRHVYSTVQRSHEPRLCDDECENYDV